MPDGDLVAEARGSDQHRLAPVWAELGAKVPMLSGRGLGITGGTLDKLEAIPGFRTDLDTPALRRALEEVGCFMNGQTARLAPAAAKFDDQQADAARGDGDHPAVARGRHRLLHRRHGQVVGCFRAFHGSSFFGCYPRMKISIRSDRLPQAVAGILEA